MITTILLFDNLGVPFNSLRFTTFYYGVDQVFLWNYYI